MKKNFKTFVSAWEYGIKDLTESKSARKGPVLRRDICFSFIDHPSTVIAFREALRQLCVRYNLLLESTSVEFLDNGASPAGSVISFLD